MTAENVTGDFDFVLLRRGRSVVLLQLLFVGVPTDIEQEFTRQLASRMR